jgi:hypothetical protein
LQNRALAGHKLVRRHPLTDGGGWPILAGDSSEHELPTWNWEGDSRQRAGVPAGEQSMNEEKKS